MTGDKAAGVIGRSTPSARAAAAVPALPGRSPLYGPAAGTRTPDPSKGRPPDAAIFGL